MLSATYIAALAAILTSLMPQSTIALGINCRGSSLCHLASWENKASERIIQVLRDAVWQSPKANETVYHSGDHVICVSGSLPVSITPSATAGFQSPEGPTAEQGIQFSLSGKINTGGICLFPQLPDGTDLTLGQIRPLTDAVVEHDCGTCGSVPIHLVDQGNNDPAPGILTFNYVKNPSCTGQCIGADGAASDPNQLKTASAKFRL